MLTTREKALVASSPAIGFLLLTLGWNVVAYRHELGTWLRSKARF